MQTCTCSATLVFVKNSKRLRATQHDHYELKDTHQITCTQTNSQAPTCNLKVPMLFQSCYTPTAIPTSLKLWLRRTHVLCNKFIVWTRYSCLVAPEAATSLQQARVPDSDQAVGLITESDHDTDLNQRHAHKLRPVLIHCVSLTSVRHKYISWAAARTW